MLTPTYVNLHYWFYPIGNTPAVDLLEYQRLPCATAAGQEQQTVKVLSIACGDPRNLLYSLWCEDNIPGKYLILTPCRLRTLMESV